MSIVLFIQAFILFIKRNKLALRGFAVDKSILALPCFLSCVCIDFIHSKVFLAFEGELTDIYKSLISLFLLFLHFLKMGYICPFPAF